MSKPWMLNLLTGTGNKRLADVPQTITLLELKERIAKETGLASNRQNLKGGFPPKILEGDDKDIKSLGLQNGDRIIVEERSGAAPVTVPTPAPVTKPITSPAPIPAEISTHVPPSPVKDVVEPPKVASPLDEDEELAKAIALSLAEASGTSEPAKETISVPEPSKETESGIKLTKSGFLVRRVVDADNSCLFNSIGYLLEGKTRTKAPLIRRIIVDAIKKDPVTFNEAILGKPVADYISWITKSDSWGGAIELSILCKHYATELAVFDIGTTRLDLYGDASGFKQRVFLLYDGLHYDPLALVLKTDQPEWQDQTVFNPLDTYVITTGQKLVKDFNKKKAFTDTAKFSLRCLVCQIGLKGEKDAIKHATETKHQNFAEY